MIGAVVLGFLFFVGIGAFTVHVYRAAVAEGVLPLPKIPKAARAPGAKRLPAREHAFRARARAVRGGRTVSVIFAEALATNWLASRKHRREQAAAAVSGTPAVPAQPAVPAPAPNGRHPAAVPTPTPAPGGPSMTNPPNVPRDDGYIQTAHGRSPGGSAMTTTTASGGASADFFSALSRVIAEAQAGGIRHKARAGLVLGEGFTQQAAALEQHARHLQDTGQYPAYVWEPFLQAAAMQRAAAAKCNEGGTAIAEIARTPAGELAGRAPHREELNRA